MTQRASCSASPPSKSRVGQEETAEVLGVSPRSHDYEFIDSVELATRWSLPVSWVRDQVRARSADPIPHIRFGKYVRFRWRSPDLEVWAERRIVSGTRSAR